MRTDDDGSNLVRNNPESEAQFELRRDIAGEEILVHRLRKELELHGQEIHAAAEVLKNSTLQRLHDACFGPWTVDGGSRIT